MRWAGAVGVLAIQGSFPLHLRALDRLGVEGRRVRKPEDLRGLRGLILPGGESTVMSLLMKRYGIFEPIRELGKGGLPMFGTCAGAILLGRGEGTPPRLSLANVDLVRNAYGAQVDSFACDVDVSTLGSPFHAVFIRAPKITRLDEEGPEVRVLARHGGLPILVEDRHFLLSTFHPELTDDLRVHEMFLEGCKEGSTATRPSDDTLTESGHSKADNGSREQERRAR